MDQNFDTIANHEIGRIASVNGSHLVVVLNPEPGTGHRPMYSAVPKGTLVKIINPRGWVYGLITAASIPMPNRERGDAEMVFAEVVMLGEVELDQAGPAERRFQRGVSLFPSVGDLVFRGSAEDLAIVYARPSLSCVRIGTIHQDQTIHAYVVPDLLLGKHFAILGSTGSGKSCATALILRRVLEAHPRAHIVVLDPHNEYAAAFPDFAEVVGSNSLDLPYWLYNFEEISTIIFGNHSEEADKLREARLLDDLIVKAKNAFSGNLQKASQVTANTPVPYRIADLINFLDTEMGRLSQNANIAPFLSLKAKIERIRNDPKFKFSFGGISTYDNMSKVLGRLLRIPVNGKPMTIIDLSAIPSEALNTVVSVICRIAFDFAAYSTRPMPILLVCEEAHRYLPANAGDGARAQQHILSRIAKEGRKYGLSLGIVSQRPSDLAMSALSQCNTILALRLSSQVDQDFVRAMLPDWGGELLDFLPSLRNAEAIIVGEGVPVPARVQFDSLPPQQLPRGATARFSSAWQEESNDPTAVDAVIHRWRNEH